MQAVHRHTHTHTHTHTYTDTCAQHTHIHMHARTHTHVHTHTHTHTHRERERETCILMHKHTVSGLFQQHSSWCWCFDFMLCFWWNSNQSVILTGKVSHQSKASPSHRSTNTTTTTPVHYTSPSSSTQTTSSSAQLLLPWESAYLGEREGQENFLVNPDDYFLPQTEIGKVSPESAADSLRTLSQVGCLIFFAVCPFVSMLRVLKKVWAFKFFKYFLIYFFLWQMVCS